MRQYKSLALVLALLLAMVSPVLASDLPKGYLALTFDDGPTGAITQELLDGLAYREVKATFFVCSYRVEQYPDTLCRIVAEGHELGLHSCCHDYLQKLTQEEALEDLSANLRSVTQVCGLAPQLFRPPGGLYSPALLDAARELGLSVILWSVDPRDWDAANHRNSLSVILENAAPGRVILMHDLSDFSVKTALQAIDRLSARGYRFCTVSEMAKFTGTELEAGKVYSSFLPPKKEDD